MENLRLAYIQTSLFWKNREANLAHFEEKIYELDDADVIVLPEMFSTGFAFDQDASDIFNGPTLKWLQMMASQKQAMILTSFLCREGGKLYNRGIVTLPDGSYYAYDKKHLWAGEDKKLERGRKRLVVHHKGWRIALFICYDLRFPEWLRNTYDGEALDYDLGVVVANWPKPRIQAWDTLLCARAIENQAYYVGVNRIGEDQNGWQFPGHTAVSDPWGNRVRYHENEDISAVCTLDGNKLHTFREEYPFYKVADFR